ncbi:MAG: hypothetical protein RLZZ224_1711 [Verrucomicrobiota bacterium]
MHWGLVAILFFRNFSCLGLLGKVDFGWEEDVGKTAKACSRFGHELSGWPVGPKARAARLSQHGRWSHTKTRRHEGWEIGDRRWGGILDFEFWMLVAGLRVVLGLGLSGRGQCFPGERREKALRTGTG